MTDHLLSRSCASGGQEEPLQGSFLLDSGLLPATRPFWFSLTGCLWCQQLMCPCLRELLIFNRSCVSFSCLSSSSPNCLCLFPQISRSSLEQELFNCLLFPSLHHASLLPAQQDCVRYGCWNYCGKALQSQMMRKSHVIVEQVHFTFFFVKRKKKFLTVSKYAGSLKFDML